MIFRYQITVNYQSILFDSIQGKYDFYDQFMVIGDICPMYDFPLSLDGERWYIMTVNYQTMVNGGVIYQTTVNHQFMVIAGIWAIYDFTPSLDGKQ